MDNTSIWTFKYEPEFFEEMVLNDDIRKKLNKALLEIPNLMLVGPAGVGKGTFTHIFLKQTGLDYLWVNCSDETSIDNIRTKVKSFATSLGITPLKVVVLNECLEESEEIITGTIDNQKTIPMNLLPVGEFSLVSYNTDKKCMENDLANVISDKIDDVYEIELEDGRTIQATKNHPFLVNRNGKIEYVELQNLKEDDEIITIK